MSSMEDVRTSAAPRRRAPRVAHGLVASFLHAEQHPRRLDADLTREHPVVRRGYEDDAARLVAVLWDAGYTITPKEVE